MKNINKYKANYFMPPEVTYDWVKNENVTKAPTWCSVDLRDGNQSLLEPMSLEGKIEYFNLLVGIGFKEIGVASPATNDAEFNFVRTLIENNLIPDDVTIQVLTQAKHHSIERTFEAIKGVKKAIVHLYNSTSVSQREQVFKKSKEEIKALASECAGYIKALADKSDSEIYFQYSPEYFTGTETDYALDICNAVIEKWQPAKDKKIIINIPTTVENAMPHIFACQIEYLSKHLKNRENVILSLHPHNDRGCAVSDAEFGLIAGATRVEGTLFGNGERTGNVDIVTVAMNMYSQGVEPNLDFSEMDSIISTCERLTHMPVYERSPYAGRLAYTAFTGSHQDSIAKGMQYWKEGKSNGIWQVPYLTIDPMDIGKKYENNIIRINSLSGKGGVCYILKRHFGFSIPESMRNDVGNYIKAISESDQKELSADYIYNVFSDKYINNTNTFTVPSCSFRTADGVVAEISIQLGNKECTVFANGNGRLDAISNAIKQYFGINYEIILYEEHAMSSNSSSKAATYIGIKTEDEICWGVGVDEDIIKSSVNALIVAVNQIQSIKQMSDKDERIVAILNYIQNNYSTVTLDSLSNEFFLSKPYLSKYIKEHSGNTFGDTVKSIRMDKAKALLKNKGMTVESISRSLGYENVEHFNRLFKKLFKMTPVQYRNSK
ncbi:MAG: 2-isopropylmalate synthase [Acutalibacteraceae bacterium]|nr:2-isopropylmalate synthase [Acutalibacteraceae bacterium]